MCIRDSGNRAMTPNQLTPAVSVPIVIDRILEQADPEITWESSFIDRFLGNAYILPKACDGLGIVADLSEVATNGFTSNTLGLQRLVYDGTGGTDTEIRSRRRFDTWDPSPPNFDGRDFTFPIQGTYELEFSMQVVGWSGLSGGAAGQFHDIRFNIEIYDENGIRQSPGENVEEHPIEFRISDSGNETTAQEGEWILSLIHI